MRQGQGQGQGRAYRKDRVSCSSQILLLGHQLLSIRIKTCYLPCPRAWALGLGLGLCSDSVNVLRRSRLGWVRGC
jgi:hypothetical protein